MKYILMPFNFVVAMVKWALDGFKVANTALFRMSICERCDRFDKQSKRCNACGCYMKLKVKIPDMKCPLDKW